MNQESYISLKFLAPTNKATKKSISFIKVMTNGYGPMKLQSKLRFYFALCLLGEKLWREKQDFV